MWDKMAAVGLTREGEDAICPVPRSSLYIRSGRIIGRYHMSYMISYNYCECRVVEASQSSSKFTRLEKDGSGVIIS